jgi:hypothetical protein
MSNRAASRTTSGLPRTAFGSDVPKPSGANGTNAILRRVHSEHGLGQPVREVVGVLYAGHLREPQGVEQMRERHVAETDRFDQTVVTGRDHGVELIVEESIRSGISHEAKVDNWKRLDTESSEVLFDGLSRVCCVCG